MELPERNDLKARAHKESNGFAALEKHVGLIIIPFNYYQLPESQQRNVVPICIDSLDRRGNPIASIWFEKGVAPVQEELRRIARIRLGDVLRVSEVTEITIHKLWERHGDDAGIWPCGRVLAWAAWEARRLAAGAAQWEINHTVPLALDSLEGDLNGAKATEELYQQRLLVDLVERRIEHERRADIREVFKMLRQGYTWEEVAQRLGDQKTEALKKRFWRWMKRNFPR